MKGHAYVSVLALLAGGLLALSLVGLVLARSTNSSTSYPSAFFGDDEDWSVALGFSAMNGSAISGEPEVTFGVRPFCTEAFEFAQGVGGTSLACDAPRNKLLPPNQLQVFVVNELGGVNPSPIIFDIDLLIASRYSPGNGTVSGKTWTLNVDLGGGASVNPGDYSITFDWQSEDVDAIPNDPLREVVLLDDLGTQLVDLRTGIASGGASCSSITGGHSCSFTVVASSAVMKDYTIRVAEAGAQTAAVIDAEPTGFEGAGIPFSAANSRLGEGADIFTSYAWDFGDGSAQDTAEEVIHHFPDDGTYTVTLTVTDNLGGTNQTTHEIDILNVDPTVNAGEGLGGFEGESIALQGAGFTDPGFDCPNCTPASQETFDFTIDWGDGTTGDEGVANATTGSPGVATTGTITGAHTYGSANTFTVQICVDDDDSGLGCDTTQVTVLGIPPTVDAGANQTSVLEGEEISLDPATFTHPGFDCPNCNPPTTEHFTFTIFWGDGTTPDAGDADYISGSPGVLTTGTVNGTHTYGNEGDYVVQICVEDDEFEQGCDTFQVNVSNVAPLVQAIQNPDPVDEGSSFFPSMLASFTDPGFGCDTCDTTTEETFTFEINWGDGTTTGPFPVASQDVTIGSPGEDTYGEIINSHRYGDDGTYTVEVTVTDNDGGVGEDTLEIQVNNVRPSIDNPGDPLPVAQAERNELVPSGENPVLASFTDPGFGCDTCDTTTEETFTATIDWGDDTPVEQVLPGNIDFELGNDTGLFTRGTVSGAHRYDVDGQFTVTVCVADDNDPDNPTCREVLGVVIGAAVDLALVPPTLEPDLNDTFDMTLQVQPNNTPVDQVLADIDFGWRLQVQQIDELRDEVSCSLTIPVGTNDGNIVCEMVDGPVHSTGDVNLATITFLAVAIGPADVKFDRATTDAKLGTASILNELKDAFALGEVAVKVQGQVDVELTVSMEAVPLGSDNIRFDVNLLPGGSLDNAIDPWKALNATPVATFTDVEGTPDASGKIFTLVLTGVDTAFYDITVVANRDGGLLPTLTNLNPNVNVDRPRVDREGTTTTDMDVLREGNVVNSLRTLIDPEIEPQPIINALDSSALVAALGTSVGEPGYNAAADFDRDGAIDTDDLLILISNYLLFSPVVVV